MHRSTCPPPPAPTAASHCRRRRRQPCAGLRDCGLAQGRNPCAGLRPRRQLDAQLNEQHARVCIMHYPRPGTTQWRIYARPHAGTVRDATADLRRAPCGPGASLMRSRTSSMHSLCGARRGVGLLAHETAHTHTLGGSVSGWLGGVGRVGWRLRLFNNPQTLTVAAWGRVGCQSGPRPRLAETRRQSPPPRVNIAISGTSA